MTLFTIGSGQKTAERFFTLLQQNEVRRVLDVRLNNTSQLSGFAKKQDLQYFLGAIAQIEYRHLPELAPTEKLLSDYRQKRGGWQEYEQQYIGLISARQPLERLPVELFAGACLLCSESSARQCHRRLLAEYLATQIFGLQIVHL